MLFLYSWIPGYSWVTYYWQALSADECRHIRVISEGPELPFTSILTLYALTKFVIPTIIKRRGRPFDTRPLEIVFHGFFFGIFGLGLFIGFYVFKGYLQFLSCTRIVLHPVLVPLRSYMAVIGIVAVHFYSIHFLLVVLNGRKLNDVHMLYHCSSLLVAHFGANYQPDENMCFCVLTEVILLTFYSMLQVLNSASIEVREKWVEMRSKIYLNYIGARQYQFNLLVVHAMIHLFWDCPLKKDLALLQIVTTIFFKQMFKRELASKFELTYCDDSFLKLNDSHEQHSSNHATNELKGKKAD